MNTKKLLIIGGILIAAGLVYFAISTSEQSSSASGQLISETATDQFQQADSASTNAPASEFSEKSVSVAAYDTSAVESQVYATSDDHIEAEFAKLSPPQGLSSATAEAYMTSRDFDRLFEYARAIDRNSESYEIEAQYQYIFNDSKQLIQNDVYLNDLTCNNRVCFAKLEYHDREDIELFMTDVFFSEGRAGMGVIARAVSIDGVNQMRIIFDYTNGSLILD